MINRIDVQHKLYKIMLMSFIMMITRKTLKFVTLEMIADDDDEA